MTPVAAPDRADVRAALGRAASGDPLDLEATTALLGATGPDLDAVVALAGSVRDEGLAAAGRAGLITYSRKVFVPLTTLCRDRCHYCTFVDTPKQLARLHKPLYMSADQVLAVVRQGAALGCKEALLTLGDRPEERWPEARQWLDDHGYSSTLEYVGAMATLITRETGLLAHLNPGVMSADELVALRPTAPSMGMMLETTSRRLFTEPGQVHHGSPDKDPAVRLAVLDDAGAGRIPFTTGLLVGIGETRADRAESLLALRDLARRHGHIQEVIVQNFRAKPRTAMRGAPDAALLEHVAAVAVARLVLGPSMRIQVPPNLADPTEFDLLVRAGADDWGGVSPLTADHVNPERPWPHLSELAARTAESGFVLTERLTAHPEYVRDAGTWIDSGLHDDVARLADPVTHLARPDAGPTTPRRHPGDVVLVTGPVGDGSVRRLAAEAAANPMDLDDAAWQRLLCAAGDDLDAVVGTADDVRRYTVGEVVTQVVNRNLTSSGLRISGGVDPATFSLADVAEIAVDAWDLGITEICVQGLIPADQDVDGYLGIVRAIKAATPRMHLHAYRPQDVWDLADRTGLGVDEALSVLRDGGVDSVPGTGVKVLSERVRRVVAPADLDIDRWYQAITAAHRLGFSSTSVLFYGHVETAAERIAHLRALRGIQDAAVASGSGGGFGEFVPIPLPGHGVPLVPGRSLVDEHRAMVAVSRLLLAGSITHIQIPWTRVGRATAAILLTAGGDDLGGTLLDGRVKPQAGVEYGLELPIGDAAALAARLMRPFRQRTTDYREPPADRKVAVR